VTLLIAALALLAQSGTRTPLHEAAAACRLDAVKQLLAGGADRLARDENGATPLMLAGKCREKDPQSAALLLAMLSTPIELQENQPISIQYAAAHRQTSVVEMFLKLGIEPDAQGSEGNRALDLACLNGDSATAKALLDHGANPKLRNKAGATPLHDAALAGNAAVLELLIDHGAEVDALDADDRATPLHYAASLDRFDAVKTLVAHGAQRALKNAQGQTARQIATKNDFTDVAEFLAQP
jgi:uncharacterized protein